jgi:Phage integrase family
VGEGLATVLLRGAKRKTRFRTVPIVSPAQRSLLEHALEHAGGTERALFTTWRNVRRDLAEACERAGIERCSPNDLRRTFASWQVEAGVPLFPIAQAMGHKDTRMLERVYGRQTPQQLAGLMARAMGLPVSRVENCNSIVSAASGSAGSGGPGGLPADQAPADTTPSESSEATRSSQSTEPLMPDVMKVPGPGIEPGTRGFSVLVQNWPRPRDSRRRGSRAQGSEAEL